MATRSLFSLAANSSRSLLHNTQLKRSIPTALAKRCITTSESGALIERPAQVRFGLIKLAVTVTPFIYIGAMISREFAAWLEEHELFVPDDDDDDD